MIKVGSCTLISFTLTLNINHQLRLYNYGKKQKRFFTAYNIILPIKFAVAVAVAYNIYTVAIVVVVVAKVAEIANQSNY